MTEENKTVIEGKYTDAIVFLSREEIEEDLYDQIQDTVNHPAFRNKVRIQPDGHWGAGCAIGFTMPTNNMVCPNVVGVDLGCGMYAFKLDNIQYDLSDETELREVDEAIRANIPIGTGQMHSRNSYHMRDDFPWDEVQEKWRTFAENHLDDDVDLGEYHPDEFEYGVEYAQNVCHKVGYSFTDVVNSCGSLGSGNHFIELDESSNGEIWCVIHSGSRGIGYNIADFHQDRAQSIREIDAIRTALDHLVSPYCDYLVPDVDEVSDDELHQWVHNKQIVDYDALKDEFAGTEDAEMIENISNVINDVCRRNFGDNMRYIKGVDEGELEAMASSDDLAYLQGSEAVEYFVDMAFAQMYASESRREMGRRVAEVLGADVVDEIESVHNYIDYEDGIMRKGATPARDGERAIIPMNMSFGSFIVRGKGNEEWNYSAPHGAGRRMSRRQAHDELSEDDFREEMGETLATALPLDESPMAYKDVDMVRQAMEPTVDIVDHLEPILSIKADD